jgi:hypothetical protein
MPSKIPLPNRDEFEKRWLRNCNKGMYQKGKSYVV